MLGGRDVPVIGDSLIGLGYSARRFPDCVYKNFNKVEFSPLNSAKLS